MIGCLYHIQYVSDNGVVLQKIGQSINPDVRLKQHVAKKRDVRLIGVWLSGDLSNEEEKLKRELRKKYSTIGTGCETFVTSNHGQFSKDMEEILGYEQVNDKALVEWVMLKTATKFVEFMEKIKND